MLSADPVATPARTRRAGASRGCGAPGPRPQARGFTLIELMIVVVIVAIGASLAVPNFSWVMGNYRVRSGAESILNGLNLARAEAVRRNAPVTFTLVGTKTGWRVTEVAAGVIQSRADSNTSGLSVTPGGAATAVTFRPNGTVDTAGGWLTQATVASATSGTYRRVVNVFGGGLIRMCDPDVTAANDPRRC